MEYELIQFLQTISPLKKETQLAVANIFHVKKIKAGDFFIKEGVYAKEIGFLQAGIMRAYFTNSEAKEYNKQFFVGPSLIGAYTSLLTKEQNKIAQMALTDCTIYTATIEQIETLYDQFHDFERLGRKVAEFYFLEKEKKELEMALLDADKRYLLFLKDFKGIDQEIPQYHIASYLGISATQLSRIRKKLYKP
jgi:CRP-like cAMP-binding protein